MSDIGGASKQATPVRYKKPKILLVSLPDAVTESLTRAGYNARSGDFGRPYRVETSDEFVPIVARASIPNHTEQEVVIVDLTVRTIANGPEGEKVTSPGRLDWYARASQGVIDPRPRVMTHLQDDFDRIYSAGGAFVIFAEHRVEPEMVLATAPYGYSNRLQIDTYIEKDNWSFLSVLSPSHLQINSDTGTEITVGEAFPILSSFLRQHLAGATFSATLHAKFALSGRGDGTVFFPLADNKYGGSVAGIILPKDPAAGCVLILPQLKDKNAAVIDLIRTVLPELLPRLFPDHEGGRWVHRNEYEHSIVLEHKAMQLEAQRKANAEIAHLDEEIEAERERLGFLHGILQKSDKALVADVKRALEFIGCSKVIDVDQEADGKTQKQEDLQVLDESPSLLVEVKGLAGMPTEADTLQVAKYVLRRVKEWNRTDVAGLSVVNHQRNLPALERDNEHAFTTQQEQDAESNGLGLITTWDLFRLIRGMLGPVW